MSGIVGIFRRDGSRVDAAELEFMTAAIAHRGPDGSSFWHQGMVGLGHCMLWTTPESLNEKLPISRADSQMAITGDVRIDNREELIEALNLSQNGICDNELILSAYEKWGEGCAEKFVGDFAFAIWDTRKQRLFCARDHFGVKPFYYYLSDNLFAFGSEIKALLSLTEIPRRLNENKVAEHLTSVQEDKENTFYKGVLRLPPAHSMSVDLVSVKSWLHWSLDPSREITLGSDQEYAEALRALFTEAVRCRMRSAYPVGSMLSGGLDSSSITCTARDLLRESGAPPLHTFSAVFDKVPECDERTYIDAVLAQNNVRPHRLHVDQASPLKDLERILWHLDELMTAGNLGIQWGIYGGAAQDAGVRVILDGFDGDTTISHGTGYLRELARARRWQTLFKEARGYARHFDNLTTREVFWTTVECHGLHPRARRVVRFGRKAANAAGRRMRNVLGVANEAGPNDYVDMSFLRRIGFEDYIKQVRLKNQIPKVQNERDNHYRRLSDAGIPSLLEILSNVASAFSIETRFPFWDKRLAEFCLAIPSNQKLHDGWNRIVMRRAMQNILPAAVQWRGGKLDISQGLKYGLWTFERKRFERVIMKEAETIEPYVHIDVLRQALNRFLENKASGTDMYSIWKSVSLALWLQHSGLTE
jgi:asparagine synthase (glutamine-hydrolysing)